MTSRQDFGRSYRSDRKCGRNWTRTNDRRFVRPVLYQLSYTPGLYAVTGVQMTDEAPQP